MSGASQPLALFLEHLSVEAVVMDALVCRRHRTFWVRDVNVPKAVTRCCSEGTHGLRLEEGFLGVAAQQSTCLRGGSLPATFKLPLSKAPVSLT